MVMLVLMLLARWFGLFVIVLLVNSVVFFVLLLCSVICLFLRLFCVVV